MQTIYLRYHKATRKEKKGILDEFCKTHHYHRKHAIRFLNGPPPTDKEPATRTREPRYNAAVVAVLQTIWETAGYPWSRLLKAALPHWIPWARKRLHVTPQQEQLLLSISPAQIDRRLALVKRKLKRRIYGRTKPGSLLKHHIPIKTDSWNIRRPGFFEIDLVSHSGNCADGDFAHTLNMVDIKTTWIARRAVLGKGQEGVKNAIEEAQKKLPFLLLGIDSDNGSEFINAHLHTYCTERKIQFTRGRPYKKNDNAHVEQKNWTTVRRLFGYLRYDTQEMVDAMNDLYRNELHDYQNLFQPSVKLKKKIRIGSKTKRVYGPPLTPLERVLQCKNTRPSEVAALKKRHQQLDPFQLTQTIDRKMKAIYEMVLNQRVPKDQKETSSPSMVIPARPKEHQNFKLHGYVSKGVSPDLFADSRFDPLHQLQHRLEREAVLK